MKKHILTLLTALLLGITAQGAQETPATDERMAWWRDARFGMFIHWGLYAVPAGTYKGKDAYYGEWIMLDSKIPVAEYANYAKGFNPVKFDADQWAQLAKDAGMKYVVITAKHHDGFCMYKTGVDDFNVVDATPFKRDPVKELAEACRKRGLKFGVYYSQAQDWHHAGGGILGNRPKWDTEQEGDYDNYLTEVSIPQVRELLKEIEPSVLWFDTPLPMRSERTQEFQQILEEHPALIYNNRLGNGVRGDTETPEQEIPASGYPGRDWETCMTMNNTWGYSAKDNNYKSTNTLLRNLIDIASKGGNYLLNVGPTAEGVIPDQQAQRLTEIGTWLKANGEAVYGTSASPFKKAPAWGRVTAGDGKLYLHVFERPEDGKLRLPVVAKVKKAYRLDKPEVPLETVTGDQWLEVDLPSDALDPIATVVAVEVDGEVVALPPPPPPLIRQAADGSLDLPVADAELEGSYIKLSGKEEKSTSCWTKRDDYVWWNVEVSKPGVFDVVVNYACAPAVAGSEYSVSAGAESVTSKVAPTANWDDYQSAKIGTLRLEKNGPVNVAIKVLKTPGGGVLNLRSIVLTPAK